MKKRFMLLAMSAMLCIGGGGQALASEKFVNLQGESLEGGIVPYFNEIINIFYTFDVDDSGKVMIGADVRTVTDGETYIKMSIQQKVGSGWRTIETFSDSDYTNRFSYYETANVDPSGTYRAYFTIKAYVDGVIADTVNEYVS
ncbi:MAG TPA: hypothetical protein IAB62_09065 [Candidatus Coprocola pullicola]|nr:hypothetical protein [Candidatus Coprocola pullicola]